MNIFVFTLLFICFLGGVYISGKELEINEQIFDEQVRVIDSNGEQLGILEINQAKKVAADQNLDLVKISVQNGVPICKIMNYGKYKFEIAKKEKESKKNQKTINTKEIRLSINIDMHDLETKVNNARKFIEKGDKVKVSIKFKGREVGHPETGYSIMQKFSDLCSEFATVDKPAKLDGKNMLMFLNSKNSNVKK